MKVAKKSDVILAYILLVILIACLVGVVMVKLLYKPTSEEVLEEPKSLTLQQIATSFNDSNLIPMLTLEDSTIKASVDGENLLIDFAYQDNQSQYTVEYVNNVLRMELKLDEEDLEQSLSNVLASAIIYQILSVNLCTYQGNTNSVCYETIDAILNHNYKQEGLNYNNIDSDTLFMSIDTNIKIVPYQSNKNYDEVTILDIDSKDYSLTLDNFKLSLPIISYDDEDKTLNFNYHLVDLKNNNRKFTLTLNLYDESDKLLKTFTSESDMNTIGVFSASFELKDISYDLVKKYSIDITEANSSTDDIQEDE